MNDTKALVQTDTETETKPEAPETETQQPEQAERPEDEPAETLEEWQDRVDLKVHENVAVGFAFMRASLNQQVKMNFPGDGDIDEYMAAVYESPCGASLIKEEINSFNPPDWLARDIAQAVLEANGRAVDKSTDLAPLAAVVQKEMREWNDCDDTGMCVFAGRMFYAGYLAGLVGHAEKR